MHDQLAVSLWCSMHSVGLSQSLWKNASFQWKTKFGIWYAAYHMIYMPHMICRISYLYSLSLIYILLSEISLNVFMPWKSFLKGFFIRHVFLRTILWEIHIPYIWFSIIKIIIIPICELLKQNYLHDNSWSTVELFQ